MSVHSYQLVLLLRYIGNPQQSGGSGILPSSGTPEDRADSVRTMP